MSLVSQAKRFGTILQQLPKQPGVYRYYSQANELLYVGKAKNLYNRVHSYFQDSKVYNQRTYIMVNQIDRIEYTIVRSEEEALVLEANLIQSLQPRFNILLKDEQNYLYARFDYISALPTVSVERKKTSPKYTYYGPFFSRYRLEELLKVMRFVLPYCQKKQLDGKACEYVALGQCAGVCCGKESIAEYTTRLKLIESVFCGESSDLLSLLQQKLLAEVTKNNFELAAYWRDRIELIKSVVERNFGTQAMVLPQPLDTDLMTVLVEVQSSGDLLASAFVQTIRRGKMVDVKNFLLTGGGGVEGIDHVVTRLLTSYYAFSKDYNIPLLLQTHLSTIPSFLPSGTL